MDDYKSCLQTSVNKQKYVNPDDRMTKPLLTKYEFVRIYGDRTQQIILGAKPMLKKYKGLSPKEIVLEEIKMKTVPFFIERELPNGNIEKWSLNELSPYVS